MQPEIEILVLKIDTLSNDCVDCLLAYVAEDDMNKKELLKKIHSSLDQKRTLAIKELNRLWTK